MEQVQQREPLVCLWKRPMVESIATETVQSIILQEQLQPWLGGGGTSSSSAATIRIEGLDEKMTHTHIMNLVSRYELVSNTNKVDPIQEYTCDIMYVPRTVLVHLRDESWARAAVRDLQGRVVFGKKLTVAQYPRQILLP